MTTALEPPPTAADADARPPWRAWTGPAALLLALVVAGLLAAVVFVAVEIAGGDPEDSNAADLVALLLQDLCFIGVALFFAQLVARPTPQQFGLRPTTWKAMLGWVVGGYLVFIVFTAIWVSALGITAEDDLTEELGVDDSAYALVAVMLLVCVLAPLAEEVLFRGYIFTALRGWAGTAGAAVLTGLVFGAIHGVSSPVGFLVPLAFFGIVLCVAYARTGSLFPCLALHALNNSIAFAAAEEWSWQIPLLIVGAQAAVFAVAVPLSRLRPRAPLPPPAPAGT